MSEAFVKWAADASCTPPSTRLRCVNWLSARFFTWGDAMAIENEVFITAQEPMEYSKQVKRLMYNLAINPDLRNVAPHVLSRMDASNMCEGTVLQIAAREKRIRHERFTAMLQQRYDEIGDDNAGHTDIQCRKCRRQTPLVLEQKQTRSADEPTTVFVTCKLCGTRWRLN